MRKNCEGEENFWVNEYYKEKILHGTIENYWRRKSPPPSAKATDSITICLDKSKEWKNYFEEKFLESFQREVTENFKKMDVLCGDLKNMLPDENSEEIERILPVLITSYIQNKKHNDSFAFSLIDGSLEEDFQYHQKVEIFIPERWEKRYSKLTERDCEESNARRIFPVFLNAATFLFFLLKTKDVCNIGLSFYIYDYLTGYLSLLSSKSVKLIDSLNQFYCRGNVADRYTEDKEIIKFAESLLDEFQYMPNPSKTQIALFNGYCKNHKLFDYPLSVYIFAGYVGMSLNSEFMPDDIESVLNGGDIVRTSIFLDMLSWDVQDSVVSEMSEEAQKLLE